MSDLLFTIPSTKLQTIVTLWHAQPRPATCLNTVWNPVVSLSAVHTKLQ